jgi:hypothetical protein
MSEPLDPQVSPEAEDAGARAFAEFFGSLPTSSSARVFNTETHFGIVVPYIETDYGFGQLVFSVDKATGAASFDDDGTRLEHCGRILERLAGTLVGRDDASDGPDE